MDLRNRNRATAKKSQPITAMVSICGQTMFIHALRYRTACEKDLSGIHKGDDLPGIHHVALVNQNLHDTACQLARYVDLLGLNSAVGADNACRQS